MTLHYRADHKGDAVIIMNTKTPWNQLADLLEGEVVLYDALKALLEAETEALIQSDLPVFKKLLGEKQAMVAELQQKEAARKQWLRAQMSADPNEKPPRLKRLIASAPPEISARLETSRRSLASRIRSIDDRNQLNGKMLRHSRALADNALRLLGNQLYVQPTYQSNGNLAGAGTGGFVLSGMA